MESMGYTPETLQGFVKADTATINYRARRTFCSESLLKDEQWKVALTGKLHDPISPQRKRSRGEGRMPQGQSSFMPRTPATPTASTPPLLGAEEKDLLSELAQTKAELQKAEAYNDQLTAELEKNEAELAWNRKQLTAHQETDKELRQDFETYVLSIPSVRLALFELMPATCHTLHVTRGLITHYDMLTTGCKGSFLISSKNTL